MSVYVCITIYYYFSNTQQQPANSASNQDIFIDLLQPDASQSLADSNTNERIIDMACEDGVLRVVGIHRIVVVDETIVVLAAVQHGWVIQLFDRDQVTRGHKTLSVSYHVCQHYVAGDNKTRVSSASHIHCCLLAGSTSATMYSNNKRSCVVDAKLFQELFGEDARLLESPILLISTPDGAVFSLPLKCVSRKRELCLVCHLKEPVVDIISFSEDAGVSSGTRSRVIFVGSRGRVVCADAGRQDRNVRFTECAIAGPVHCLTVHNQHLVYSTRRQLCYVPLLELTEKDCRGQTVQCAAWALHGVAAVTSLCALTCSTGMN